MNTSTANNSGWPTSSGTAPSAGRKHHHRSKRQALKEWKRRPQDRYGFLPEALFQTRKRNMSRKTGKERRTRLLWSYAPDWIVTVVLWIAFYALDSVDGFRRQFDLNDPSIQHTFATSERVPVWALAVIAGIAPALIMALFSGLFLRSFWDVHNSLLGLVLALALSTTATDIVKITVGRPRPDMLDRCQPASGSSNAPPPSYGLSNSSICTTSDFSRLKDGFRSFPSGHSSFAFAGLGFLALWIAGKLRVMDGRGHAVKAWIAFTPLVAAALVAISRTMDYRHHWQDVFIGSILGYLLAWFSYRLYFPRLHDPSSHKPYSPRIPSDLPTDPTYSSSSSSSDDEAGEGTALPQLRHGGRAGGLPEGTVPRERGRGAGVGTEASEVASDEGLLHGNGSSKGRDAASLV